MDVLVVDDDEISQKVLSHELADEFTVYLASNGPQAIDKAMALVPDIILLDVSMPGMSGYDVCRRLRKDPRTIDIPVIFLTAHTSLDHHLQGFEAGGDDYISKPYESKAIRARMQVLLRMRVRHLEVRDQYEDARKTAHIAMSGNSEMGIAMQFIEGCFGLHSEAELAQAFFAFTKQLDLSCSLLFFGDGQEACFSSAGAVSPLEKELMQMLHKEKRIYDFGQRTVFNFAGVSLLVKNMPLKDMARYGRIKDLLPAVLGAVDAKVRALHTHNALLVQVEEQSAIFSQIQTTLLSLANTMRTNQDKSVHIMRNMMTELTMFLPRLALEDDQETKILDYIEGAIIMSSAVIDNSDDVLAIFRGVAHELNSLMEKQQNMVDALNESMGPESDTQDSPVQVSTTVELF